MGEHDERGELAEDDPWGEGLANKGCLEHFAQIGSRWLGLGVENLRLRRVFKKSGRFCPWLRCRSTGYTFSQTALNNDEMGGRGFRHGTEGDVLVEGNQAAVVFDRKGEQVEVG